MATNAYQMAGLNTALTDSLIKQQNEAESANIATATNKKEMMEEFEAQMKAAQDKARKKSKKFGGLGKLLDVAGMFMGPLGAGLTKGIGSLLQAEAGRKGAKGLMKGIDAKRFGKTFLSKGLEKYQEEVKDSQSSFGDSLAGGLMSGVVGGLTSKAMGGSKDDNLFKKMFEKPEDVAGSNLGIGKSEQFMKDSSPLGEMEMFGNKSSNFDKLTDEFNVISADRLAPEQLNIVNKNFAGGLKGSKPGFLPSQKSNIQLGLGKNMGGNFDVAGINKAGTNPFNIPVPGKRTPFKNLMGGLKDKFAGIKDQGLDEDMLMQLMKLTSGGQ